MSVEKNIPRMRTNRDTFNRIFGMYAGLQEFERAAKEEESRFRAIPNGWRDVRLIIAKATALLEDTVATVPPEKLPSMLRMLPRMRFNVHCGVQASGLGEDECVISCREMDVLCKYAHEQCKLCVDENCKNCELGRVLDSVMAYDRDGRSWAGVQMTAAQD